MPSKILNMISFRLTMRLKHPRLKKNGAHSRVTCAAAPLVAPRRQKTPHFRKYMQSFYRVDPAKKWGGGLVQAWIPTWEICIHTVYPYVKEGKGRLEGALLLRDGLKSISSLPRRGSREIFCGKLCYNHILVQLYKEKLASTSPPPLLDRRLFW